MEQLIPLAIIFIGIIVFFLLLSLWRFWRRPTPPDKPESIPPGDYTYTIEYLEYRIAAAMKSLHLPSVVVALVDDQEVVLQSGFGYADVDRKVKATTKTIYKLGSISKLFTTMEILRLYEEGLIDLDAPISNYLPDFSINSRFPNSRPITLRSILTHRSGLPRNGNLPDWGWETGPDVLDAITRSLKNAYQAYPVDYRFKYSNAAFNVLGRIIEVIRKIEPLPESPAGKWSQFMKENLLRPIGMKNSSFASKALLGDKLVKQFIAFGYAYQHRRYHIFEQYDVIRLASGNLHSTVEDLANFLKFLNREGEVSGKQLLQKETIKMMLQERTSQEADPQQVSLGWFSDETQLGETVAYQSGIIQGTTSIVALIPGRKLGVVFISNSDAFEQISHALAFKALALMLETKHGIKPPVEKEAEAVKISKGILGSFAGKYVINGEITPVFLRDEELVLQLYGQDVRLIPVSDFKFRAEHHFPEVGPVSVTFVDGTGHDADNLYPAMILTVDKAYNTTCPKYPQMSQVPHLWQTIAGRYDIYTRQFSADENDEPTGKMEISLTDNVLLSPFHQAALKPLNELEILILGGAFDGELMIRDRTNGNLSWSSQIYKPHTGRRG